MLFECYTFLQSLNLLGALISTKPENSVAVFVDHGSGKSSLSHEGDLLSPQLKLTHIQPRKNLVFECNGEVVTWRFWSKSDWTEDPYVWSDSREIVVDNNATE